MAPGMVINVDDLLKEISDCKVEYNRLHIDPQVMVINDEDIEAEKNRLKKISSTCQGVGEATARKIRHRGDKKLRLAEELGATHTINATREDVAESIRKLTIGGADYTIMATTNAVAAAQAIEAIGFGGTCVFIGAPPRETKVDLDFLAILMERTIKGCIFGSSRATLDIPLYIDLYLAGRLPLDKLVTKRYPLTEINAAFESLEKGEEITCRLDGKTAALGKTPGDVIEECLSRLDMSRFEGETKRF